MTNVESYHLVGQPTKIDCELGAAIQVHEITHEIVIEFFTSVLFHDSKCS